MTSSSSLYSARHIEQDDSVDAVDGKTPYECFRIFDRISRLVATVFGFCLTIYGANQSKQGAQNKITDMKKHGRSSDNVCSPHSIDAYMYNPGSQV